MILIDKYLLSLPPYLTITTIIILTTLNFCFLLGILSSTEGYESMNQLKEKISKRASLNIQNEFCLYFRFKESEMKMKTSLRDYHMLKLIETSARLYHSPDIYKEYLLLVDTVFAYKKISRWAFNKYIRTKSLLIADIDVLPVGFIDWESFYNHCLVAYPDSIVLRSPRGKVKIFFLIENQSKEWPSKTFHSDRISLLKNLLKNDSIVYDTSTTAHYRCYFSFEMYLSFKDQIPKLKTQKIEAPKPQIQIEENFVPKTELKIVLNSVIEPEAKPTEQKSKRSKLKAIPFSNREIIELVKRPARKSFSKFISYLLSQSHLEEGSALAVERICSATGITQRQGYNYISVLCENGLLEQSESYRYSSGEAKISKVKGNLLIEYKKHHKSALRPIEQVVSSIRDGEWHSNLFLLTNYFTTEADFIAFCYTIPHFDKKDRRKMAHKAWRSHLKLNSNHPSPLK